MKTIKKFILFVKLVFIWFKTKYWIKRCKNPLKLSILQVMQEGALAGFKLINWWIPKHTPNDAPPEINLQKLSQAAYLEKHGK